MKLLIDADLSPLWVPYIEEAGIEVRHWYTLGPQSATDVEIMAYAVQHGFTVLTRDLDFGTLLVHLEAALPSEVQIRANPSEPHYIGPQVTRALKDLQDELENGALVTIDPKRIRARLLPFRRKQDPEAT